MKTENLKIGRIKNYKELCAILNIPVKAGNTKKAQLKELERYCKYTQEGHSFVITEIYDTVLPKSKPENDGRGKSVGSRGNNTGVFQKDIAEVIMFNMINELKNKTTEDKYINISKTSMYMEACLVNHNFYELYPMMKQISDKEDIPIQVVEYFYNNATSKMKKNIESVLNYMQRNFWIKWSYQMSVKLVNGGTRLATDDEVYEIISLQKKVLLEHGIKDIKEIYFTDKYVTIQKEVNKKLKEEFGFEYFFNSFYIIPSRSFEEYASTFENIEDVRKNINNNMIISSLKSAEKKHNKVVDECGIVVNENEVRETVGTKNSFIAKPEFIGQITRLIDMYIKRGSWKDETVQDLYQPITKEIQYFGDMTQEDLASWIDNFIKK